MEPDCRCVSIYRYSPAKNFLRNLYGTKTSGWAISVIVTSSDHAKKACEISEATSSEDIRKITHFDSFLVWSFQVCVFNIMETDISSDLREAIVA